MTHILYVRTLSPHSEHLTVMSFSRFQLRFDTTCTNMVMWSFGYGSNMDVTALRAKKHVNVLGKFNIM